MKLIKSILLLSVTAVCFVLAPQAGSLAQDGSHAAHEPKEIVFILPTRTDAPHAFFDDFQAAMEAATTSLGDELVIAKAESDHYKMLEITQSIVDSDDKPDAVVFISMRQNGQKALETLEQGGVNSFIVNAGLTDEQYQAIGLPREKMAAWLGEMLPDDSGAGYALGEALYEKALEAKPELKERKVKMLVIEANPGDSASIFRTQGLNEYLETNPDIEVIQYVKAKWEKERAKELTEHMFRRYGDIDIIWAASDAMAIGGAEVAMEKGLKPGEDIFIGGVDWSDEGLSAIEEGVLTASAGGHIMEGAWAAVVLHDYLHGYDFAETGIGTQMNSPMYIADKDNVDEIKSKIGGINWQKIDFTKFSKAHNPEIKEYDFNILGVTEMGAADDATPAE